MSERVPQESDECPESERRNNIFGRVGSICARLQFTGSSVFDIKCEDDALDILRVLFWDSNSQGVLSGGWKRVTNEPPPAMLNINAFDLINKSGIFADVFVQHFEMICVEAPADSIPAFAVVRDRIAKPSEVFVPNSRPKSMVGQPSFQWLLDELSNVEEARVCADLFQSKVGTALVAGAQEFSLLNECKLVGAVRETAASEGIDTAEQPDEPRDEEDVFQNLLNKIQSELKIYLNHMNNELVIQNQNFVEMCELFPKCQEQIGPILQEGRFSNADIKQLASNGLLSLESIQRCSQTDAVITVCGETSTGKTTLMAGITTSLCFRTSDAANSACPIRVCVSNERSQARSFVIPPEFRFALEDAFEAIKWSITTLRREGIAVDMPANVTSKDAIELFHRLADPCNKTATFQPDIMGSSTDSDATDIEIGRAISELNGLVRLFYNLKESPRFAIRLGDVDPIAVLLRASNIIQVLPTLTSYCECVQGLPFTGRINFIDTIGVSEAVEKGSFMEFSTLVMQRILEQSHGAIVLVTPTRTSSGTSKGLRKLIRNSMLKADNIVVAVNKFDTAEVGEGAHWMEEALEGYRALFAEEGLGGVHVQVLKAIVLRDTIFGWKDLVKAGGMKAVKEKRNSLTPATKSLLITLFGAQYWQLQISDAHAEKACQDLAPQSNLDNLLRVILRPAFLEVMTKEPKLCLKYHAKMIASMMTTMNTRLAAILREKEALKLLSDSIEAIDAIFLTKIPEIVGDIHDALLKEFVSHARIVIRNTLPLIHPAVAKAERETAQKLGLNIHTCQKRTCTTKVLWHGEVEECVVQTPVYFKKATQCDMENKRVKIRVNEILASTGIEAAWEILRKKRVSEIIESRLRKVGEAIKVSLTLEFDGNQHLQDMYKSILSEIQDCVIIDSSLVNNAVQLDLFVTPLQTRDAEGLAAYFFNRKEDIFIPHYAAIATYGQRTLTTHYSPQNCDLILSELGLFHGVVISKVAKQLEIIRAELKHLHDCIAASNALGTQVDLKGYITNLNNFHHTNLVLIKAIERKCSTETLINEERLHDGLVEGWKRRMMDCPPDAFQGIVKDCPIRLLFECRDDSVTFVGATDALFNLIHSIESLSGTFEQLHKDVELAWAHALDQERIGQLPQGMSLDELAVLKLYTLPGKLYQVMNSILRTLDVEAIRAMQQVIWLLKKAMMKLPSPPLATSVFRGVALELHFEVGQQLIWNAFTSTSTNSLISHGGNYFGCSGPRTHFVIQLAPYTAARSLCRVSVLPEEEVLLPPFTVFIVEHVGERDADGCQEVFLQEISGADPLMDDPNEN